MAENKRFRSFTKPFASILAAILLACAVAATLACACFASTCLPAKTAWADEPAQAQPGQLKSVTMSCVYNLRESDGKQFTNDSKFMVLNDNGTGMISHKSTARSIVQWGLDGSNFTATDHLGNAITGTLDANGVLTVKYDGYTYKFTSGENAPIMSLSPGTWFAGLSNVTDQADILTAEQEAALQKRAQEISEKYKCGVYIVLLSDLKTFSKWNTIEACAEEVRVGYQLGYGSDKDCVALVMSMAARDYDLISYGPFASKVFDSKTREWVTGKFLPDFKKNDWNAGFNHYLDAVDTVLAKNAEGSPYYRPAQPLHIAVSILVCLLVALPIGYLVSRGFRNRMKSVSAGYEASKYQAPEGGNITYRDDSYSHTDVTRIYSPPPKDSGGGGGGRSFTSSGGVGHTSGKF